MDEGVKSVVKEKKIILFKRMIKERGRKDTEAPELLIEGVDLTGRSLCPTIFRGDTLLQRFMRVSLRPAPVLAAEGS